MEKQTKILLGLAAAGVVAYLVFKPKKAVVQNTTDPYLCPQGYKLTAKPMGLSSMIVCEDSNNNQADKIVNPNYDKNKVIIPTKNKDVPMSNIDWKHLMDKVDNACIEDPNSYNCYVSKGGGFMPILKNQG